VILEIENKYLNQRVHIFFPRCIFSSVRPTDPAYLTSRCLKLTSFHAV